MTDLPKTYRRMVSEVAKDGALTLRLDEAAMPEPGPGQVVIKVEAAPINPSDLALMIGMAETDKAEPAGSGGLPGLTMPIPRAAQAAYRGRAGQALPCGNEGAGTVVATGAGSESLIGSRVAAAGGAMFAEYQLVPASLLMPLPEGVTAEEGASSFVNPMTSLAMTEVMKTRGSPALVHTAAASNLGQMLQRICKADGIPLINIVRKPAQQAILKDLGADYALNSEDERFLPELIEGCAATGATIGFDATGGGALAGQIITAMELAAQRQMTEYSRYGSDVEKHVFIYGRLDLSPTLLPPSLGMAWGVGGFLLPNFLKEAGGETRMRMAGRVLSELKTTFKSTYTSRISLEEALQPDIVAAYNARRTGEKYLLVPGGA